MLVLAIVFFVQKSVKPIVGLVLLLAAFVMGVGAFTLQGDADGTSSDATIEIVSPEQGATVAANEPLELEIDLAGGTLLDGSRDGNEEGHLHVFVDLRLVDMPSTETAVIELDPGGHEIMVEYTSADHHSFDPRVFDTVNVTAQ